MERWEVTSEEEQSESMVGKLIDKGMKPTKQGTRALHFLANYYLNKQMNDLVRYASEGQLQMSYQTFNQLSDKAARLGIDTEDLDDLRVRFHRLTWNRNSMEALEEFEASAKNISVFDSNSKLGFSILNLRTV